MGGHPRQPRGSPAVEGRPYPAPALAATPLLVHPLLHIAIAHIALVILSAATPFVGASPLHAAMFLVPITTAIMPRPIPSDTFSPVLKVGQMLWRLSPVQAVAGICIN